LNLEEAIENSEFLLVEGGKKQGKLTFTLFCSCKLIDDSSHVVIFSPFPRSLMNKRISIISDFADNELRECLQQIELLCLKENYRELKALYGLEFIANDIEKAIEKVSANIVILHRLDAMFEIQESSDAEWFIETIISIKKRREFKLFITTGMIGDEQSFIHDILENYMDMNLMVKKGNNAREVEVLSSIYPVKEGGYTFCKIDNKLKLTTMEEAKSKEIDYSTSVTKSESCEILLIAREEEFVALNRFIFGGSQLNLSVVSSPVAVATAVMKGPDLIILDTSDSSEIVEISKLISQYGLKSKIISILDKEYVRSTDKLDAAKMGCYDIFSRNFIFEEYIMSIERILDSRFYSSKIENLSLSEKKYGDKIGELCEFLRDLQTQGIYFSLLTAIGDIDIESIETKIRERDVVCKVGNSVIIAFINSRVDTVKRIVDVKFDSLDSFEIEEISDVLNWKSIEEKLCEK
jgi:hypothetical protein